MRPPYPISIHTQSGERVVPDLRAFRGALPQEAHNTLLQRLAQLCMRHKLESTEPS
jgi:hypothetical protein